MTGCDPLEKHHGQEMRLCLMMAGEDGGSRCDDEAKPAEDAVMAEDMCR